MKLRLFIFFILPIIFFNTSLQASSTNGLSINTEYFDIDKYGYFQVEHINLKTPLDIYLAENYIFSRPDYNHQDRIKYIEIQTANNNKIENLSDLNIQASALFERISKPKEKSKKSPIINIKLDSLLKNNLNVTLSIIRFIANSGLVTTSIVLGHQVSIERALIVGLIAGGISGYSQYKIEYLEKWLTTGKNFVNAYKKLKNKINSSSDFNSKLEKVNKIEYYLNESEKYLKWGAMEFAFLSIINSTMLLFDIPSEGNLLLTVLKSTASQGVLEIGIYKAVQHLKNMNPHQINKINNYTSLGMFFSSGFSVMTAAAALAGIPIADFGFITMTTAGLSFSLYPMVAKKFKPQQNQQIKFQCANLF